MHVVVSSSLRLIRRKRGARFVSRIAQFFDAISHTGTQRGRSQRGARGILLLKPMVLSQKEISLKKRQPF